MSIKRFFFRNKRRKESIFKYGARLLHLWLGGVALPVIVVVCLSGSIYALKPIVDNFIRQSYFIIDTEKTPQIDLAIADFTARFGVPTQVHIESSGYTGITVTNSSKMVKGVTAFYSYKEGNYLGVKNADIDLFFDFILSLHRFLLMGDIGKFIVGVATLIMLIVLLTGIVVWIPKQWSQLKTHLSIRLNARFLRVNYDWHRVVGFYSSFILIFIALTGLYISFYWCKNILIQLLGGPSILLNEKVGSSDMSIVLSNDFNAVFEALLNEKEEGDDSCSLQELFELSQIVLPDSASTLIKYPLAEDKLFSICNYTYYAIHDVLELNRSGRIIQLTKFDDLRLFEQFIQLAKPLHTGEVFGLTGAFCYAFVSLLGCTLPITGLIIWFKKSFK